MSIDPSVLAGAIRQRLVRLRLDRVTDPATDRRMTQAELADAISVTRATVANIENGRQRVSLEMLYRISDALGVDPVSLLPNLDEVRVYVEDGATLAHDEELPPAWSNAVDEVE